MTYPLTFVVNGWPLKDGMAGCAVGPVIFIREGYEKDEGLAEHELIHIMQMGTFAFVGMILCQVLMQPFPQYGYWPVLWGALAGMVAGGLAYKFIRPYRIWAEVQAYREQMNYPDRFGNKMTLETGAYRLALPVYDLGLTIEQAKLCLS